MSPVSDFRIPASAAVLEPKGVRSRRLGPAMQQIWEAVTEGQTSRGLPYGVVVYGKKQRQLLRQPAASAMRFSWGYLRALKVVRRNLAELSAPLKAEHSPSLQAMDFGDVRFFLGKTSLRHAQRTLGAAPGVYIISSRTNAELFNEIGLPMLPGAFLHETPVVIHVKNSALLTEEGEEAAPVPSSQVEAPELQPRKQRITKSTLEWRRKFMSEHESLTSAQVADESSSTATNRAAIASRWLSEGKIFSVNFERQNRFPAFQFRHGEPIPAVADVIQVFPDNASEWELAYFFATPNPSIAGRKPLELLEKEPKRVLSLAKAFAHPADVF